MSKTVKKTNALRMLDQHKIDYLFHTYDASKPLSAQEVAQSLNQPQQQVFKTLVTTGKHQLYVFVIPSFATLNMKKAAQLVQEKSIEMLPQKELLKKTGYIHGGCSPIGMKTLLPTWIDSTALQFPYILCSAGQVGMQLQIDPQILSSLIDARFADLV